MKPVAFIDCFSGKPKLIDGYVIQTEYDIPLYTNLVELTDEEIHWLATEYTDDENVVIDYFSFAKAILRKAQEK